MVRFRASESDGLRSLAGFNALPIICPDNCLAEIIGAINESEETLYISAQYFDVDWYWGFNDANPC